MQTSTKPYLLFDLDGPLLEVKFKYYAFYKTYLTHRGFVPLSTQAYWGHKRERQSNEDVLSHSGATHEAIPFTLDFKNKIETVDYLELDELQNGAVEFLHRAIAQFTPALVTMRRNRANLLHELAVLKLSQYFAAILCAGDLPNAHAPSWQIKRDLVNRFLGTHSGSVVAILGDTETDMRAGRALNCPTIAVENGIRARHLLLQENPDHIVSGIHDLSIDTITSLRA